jgi:DNA-directed RNA polymerase subunit M/transcription elongation factor TFIIS
VRQMLAADLPQNRPTLGRGTDCPKCGKATRIVRRVKDRERDVPAGVYSCSECEFFEKLQLRLCATLSQFREQ